MQASHEKRNIEKRGSSEEECKIDRKRKEAEARLATNTVIPHKVPESSVQPSLAECHSQFIDVDVIGS
jgi:hypothetical protein